MVTRPARGGTTIRSACVGSDRLPGASGGRPTPHATLEPGGRGPGAWRHRGDIHPRERALSVSAGRLREDVVENKRHEKIKLVRLFFYRDLDWPISEMLCAKHLLLGCYCHPRSLCMPHDSIYDASQLDLAGILMLENVNKQC